MSKQDKNKLTEYKKKEISDKNKNKIMDLF